MSDFIASLDESSLQNVVKELQRRVSALEQRVVMVNALDEFGTDDLGDMRQGSFGAVDSEGRLRLLMSAVNMLEEYGIDAHFAGFDEDGIPTFWLSADDGSGTFCNGQAKIGSEGITISQINYLIEQIMNDGTIERIGYLGGWSKPGSTEPCFGLRINADADVTELVTNGGFESGDFTGWTKTTESNGTWAVDSDAYEGNYAAHFSANNKLEKTGVLTLDRISVTELTNYHVTAAIKAVLAAEVVGHAKIQVKWYDAASGGTLLKTDQVAYIETATAINYTNFVTTLVAPVGALSCEFVCTAYKHAYATRNLAIDVHFDGISLKSVSLNSTLYFDHLGKLRLNDNLFVPDSWFGAFPQFRAYHTDGTEYEPSTRSFDDSNFYMGLGQSNGDYFTNNVLLAAGTYTLTVFRGKNSSYGKYDVYVDGVKVTSTPLDFYNSSFVESNLDISGIVIHSDGVHEIKFLSAGKHASSTGYNLSMGMMGLYRTA